MRRCNSAVARAGLWVVAAALILDSTALVVDVIKGRRIVSGVPVEESGLDFSSTLSGLANLALPVAVLIGGLAFLWWLHCAYGWLDALSGGRANRFAPLWAVLGWIVPVLNLVRPPQIMTDLGGRPPTVWAWWLTWMAGAVIQVALRLVAPVTQRGWIQWQLGALFADLVLLISLCLAALLVDDAVHRLRRLAAHQQQRAYATAA